MPGQTRVYEYRGRIPNYPNTTITASGARIFVGVSVPEIKGCKGNRVLITNSIVEI